MATPILTILLSEAAAKAICWTLVHSLWQGTLAALIAGGIIITTRKQSAALRYNLLTALAAAFVLLAATTFVYQLKVSQPQPNVITEVPVTAQITNIQFQQQNNTLLSPAAHPSIDILQLATDYLNAHAALVTLIWLACFLAQLLRLTGGLYNIHRLRRDSTTHPSEYWAAQLITLAKQLGIDRSVSLLQSRRVKTPAAIGWLKPAILVPLGLLAQLPAHQVETILLHELAHIRRNDYLANLLLHCTEAIFFFNPGIRWISSLIRREREACCDDVVLAGTTDRNNYFEALVAFSQLAIDNRAGNRRGAYMLQFSGARKTDLLWRIRRMLEKENKKLHLLEKTILSLALFALVSFSLIKPQTQTSPTAAAATKATPAISATSAASGASTKSTINAPQATGSGPSIAPPAPAPPPPVPPTSAGIAEPAPTTTSDSPVNTQEPTSPVKGEPNTPVTVEPTSPVIVEPYIPITSVPNSPVTGQPNAPVNIEPISPMSAKPVSPVTPITATTPVAPIKPIFRAKPGTPIRSLFTLHPAVGASDQDSTPHTERRPTLAYPVVFSKNLDIDILHIAVDLVKSHLITNVDKYEFHLSSTVFTVNGAPVAYDIAKEFRKKYVLGPDYNFDYSQYWTTAGSGSHCMVQTPNHTANLTNRD